MAPQGVSVAADLSMSGQGHICAMLDCSRDCALKRLLEPGWPTHLEVFYHTKSGIVVRFVMLWSVHSISQRLCLPFAAAATLLLAWPLPVKASLQIWQPIDEIFWGNKRHSFAPIQRLVATLAWLFLGSWYFQTCVCVSMVPSPCGLGGFPTTTVLNGQCLRSCK